MATYIERSRRSYEAYKAKICAVPTQPDIPTAKVAELAGRHNLSNDIQQTADPAVIKLSATVGGGK